MKNNEVLRVIFVNIQSEKERERERERERESEKIEKGRK